MIEKGTLARRTTTTLQCAKSKNLFVKFPPWGREKHHSFPDNGHGAAYAAGFGWRNGG
jgi:hypothetical protein